MGRNEKYKQPNRKKRRKIIINIGIININNKIKKNNLSAKNILKKYNKKTVKKEKTLKIIVKKQH